MQRNSALFIVSGVLLILLFFGNIFFGSVHIAPIKVWAALTGGEVDEVVRFVVVESRLPQAMTALLAGAGLAVCGLMLQTVFHNPLADPSILGVNSGASLGVAVVMLVWGGSVTAAGMTLGGFLLIVMAAFVGALLIIALLLMFSTFMKNNLTLLIVGIMISYVTSSVISLLNYSATEQGVHSYIIWGLGNFNGVGLKGMPFYAGSLMLCMAGSLTLIKPLNTLLLGSAYARNLGTNLTLTRTWLLVLTGLIAAVVTAFCGPISFIGLAVPHIARMLSRSANHRILMPLTLLLGADISLLCALVCTLPANGALIPLNVITPLFGVPVILYVLLAHKEVK